MGSKELPFKLSAMRGVFLAKARWANAPSPHENMEVDAVFIKEEKRIEWALIEDVGYRDRSE